MDSIKPNVGEVLVLRCCRADGTSRNGFAWPEVGEVSAPDWKPTDECGHGLHGWLRGEGDPDCWSHEDTDLWMVVAVDESKVIQLGGKVKFPSCRVIHRGLKVDAVKLMCAAYPHAAVMFGTATAGYSGTATAGYRGTATAGNGGVISILHWDHKKERYRMMIGYVGEDGLKPDTAYKLNDQAQFEEVKP